MYSAAFAFQWASGIPVRYGDARHTPIQPWSWTLGILEGAKLSHTAEHQQLALLPTISQVRLRVILYIHTIISKSNLNKLSVGYYIQYLLSELSHCESVSKGRKIQKNK